MNKIIQNIYLFSKLGVTLILFICLIGVLYILFMNYQKESQISKNTLKKTKGVVLVGDMNVCHTELDYYGNVPESKRGPGLLPEEKKNFTDYICNGMIDTFRYKYPNVDDGFTWWTPLFKQARGENKGWRIDYALVTDDIIDNVKDSLILKDVMGSDHCPVMLELEF